MLWNSSKTILKQGIKIELRIITSVDNFCMKSNRKITKTDFLIFEDVTRLSTRSFSVLPLTEKRKKSYWKTIYTLIYFYQNRKNIPKGLFD